MKISAIFCCLFFLLIGNSFARQVSFIGKVFEPSEKQFTLGYTKEALTGEQLIYQVQLNAENGFAISCELEAANWITIRYGEESFELFIADKVQNVKFNFTGGNARQTIKFFGESSADNSFLFNFRRIYNFEKEAPEKYEEGGLVTKIVKEIAYKAKSYEAYDYFKIIEERSRHQRNYLNTQAQLDKELFFYFDKFINWHTETNKIAYFLLNKDRFDVSTLRTYWGRYGVLASVDINDGTVIEHPRFQNLLNGFIHYLDLESPGDQRDQDLAYYRFIDGNLAGKVKYFMLAKLMLDSYSRESNPRLAQLKIKSYKQANPFPAFSDTLDDIFGVNLKYVSKTTIPNFKGMEPDESEINFSEFQGRVVYISFWASWCGPCLQNFRDTYAVRQQLEKRGVVFLNVNLDESTELWKKALARENIVGKNIFALELQALQEVSRISTLPHYILVNKAGQQTYLSTDNLQTSVADFSKLLSE